MAPHTQRFAFSRRHGHGRRQGDAAKHIERQRAVFDEAAAYFASPEASPPEVEAVLDALARRVVAGCAGARRARPRRRLRAGCLSRRYGAYGASAVVGVDLSPRMVAEAEAKGGAGVSYAAADAVDFCATYAGEPFDAVVFNACFGNFFDQAAALDAAATVLTPGGTVVVAHPLGADFVDELKARDPSVVPHGLPRTEDAARRAAARPAPRRRPTHPLVAHYSFDDGTAAEDSDGSLDGTISGATATTGRDGSGALSFDGTDDYVDFPAAVTADILGGAARTVCLWAKVDDLSGGDFLFGYGSENSYLAFGLQTGSTASDVFTVQFWNWYPDVEMPGSDDGDWHHYCLTYDGSDWTLYLDGSQAGTGAVAANTGTFNTLRLGHWYSVNYAIGYFSGAIDEVYVYSSALDAAAVQVLYDAVTPPPTPAPTPRPTRSCRTVQFSKHYLWNWGTPHSVWCGDVDGDGDVDELTAHATPQRVIWYENDGQQSFSERVAAGAEAAGAEVDEVPAGAEVDEVPAGAEVDEVPAGAGADVRQPNRGEAAALRRVIRSILSAATHYEVLGVAPDAADAEISEVYRDLARTVHPDKPPATPPRFGASRTPNPSSSTPTRARYDATLRSRRP
ncbi:hypothetical protein JL720_306 [Aureococcus anophagefferens]|nr:hypothetical protein JL720_306 [Aureococcus anophagefferens]